MLSSNAVATALLAGLLAAGIPSVDSATTAAAAKSSAKSSGNTHTFVLKSKRRVARPRYRDRQRARLPRIHLPTGAAYIYQDYPYYYRRGYYPKHIGGYVYENPNTHGRNYLTGGRCSNRQRRCVAR